MYSAQEVLQIMGDVEVLYIVASVVITTIFCILRKIGER